MQYHVAVESDPARVCPKRQMWHLTCHVEDCNDCRVFTIDASHHNKMTFAGSLASWIVSNLKVALKDDKTGASLPNRHTLLNEYAGCIGPKNIDFDKIQKNGKSKLFPSSLFQHLIFLSYNFSFIFAYYCLLFSC